MGEKKRREKKGGARRSAVQCAHRSERKRSERERTGRERAGSRKDRAFMCADHAPRALKRSRIARVHAAPPPASASVSASLSTVSRRQQRGA